MSNGSLRSASLLGQSSGKVPSGALGRRRITKASSNEVSQSPQVKHKFGASDDTSANLSWENFKEKSTSETAEKFLWDANISSEVNRMDNIVLKDILVFCVAKYKRSRPIQMRAYQLLQDLTLSTSYRPFYTPEELRERFDVSLETLQTWKKNEYVLAACLDYLASLYFRDLVMDYPDATPMLISLTSDALSEHQQTKTVVRAAIALLLKVYEFASPKTMTSSASVEALPKLISVLEGGAEEKSLIYQICSLFCTVAEKKPELLHNISEAAISAALKVLPHHRKNIDVCSAVYALVNDIAIDEKHVRLLLHGENKAEFGHLCRSVPLFQASGYVDAIDAVLMVVKKCVCSNCAQDLTHELDVVSVCVGDARRHQPHCSDVTDCMAHAHCGITQLHLALCSSIEDAMAVIAMNAEGADIIDISVHHKSSDSIEVSASVAVGNGGEREGDIVSGSSSSSVSSIDYSDSEEGETESGAEKGHEGDDTGSVDSDEHLTAPASSSVSTLLRGFGGSSTTHPTSKDDRSERTVGGDSMSALTSSVTHAEVAGVSRHVAGMQNIRSRGSSIASQSDGDLPPVPPLPPVSPGVTSGEHQSRSSVSVRESPGDRTVGSASRPPTGGDSAAMLLIKSLQKEVDEWRGKYELMKDAHDLVLEMLAAQEEKNSKLKPVEEPAGASAWSPIKLESLGLDEEDLAAYHGEGDGMGGEFVEHDDIEFEESDYLPVPEGEDDRTRDVGESGDSGVPVEVVDENEQSPQNIEVSALVDEAYSQVPKEDAKQVRAGVSAALDYMAQCQIRTSLKDETALSCLNAFDSAQKGKPDALRAAKVNSAAQKELIFVMALMFHYLRSRQAATAEKITGSGGRTRYSITRTMLRRVLMNKDLNLVHSSRLPVPEVDIILHLLPVQVDLYSVTFAFVACAVRRVHLRDFYNSEECTSVVRRLLQNLNKYCSQRDILRRSKKSMMSTSMAVPPVDSSKTSWSVDQSMFLAEISDETREQSMKLLGKEDSCLQAMFRIYSDASPQEGLDLTAVIQLCRDFSIIPVLLTMEHIIAIFERACASSPNPQMRSRLSYTQFKVALLEIAQSCNCFGEAKTSGGNNGPRYIEKVATLLWFMSNSSGRERMLERDRCAASVPPFKVNWRILVFDQPSTRGTRDKLKTAHIGR